MTITIANPTNATGFKDRYEVDGEAEINCIMQWECIRSFMERGPDACPEPSKYPRKAITLAEYKASRKQMRKELSLWPWIMQKLIDWLQYSYFFHWFSDVTEARTQYDIFPENIKRWSEPLPKDQWKLPSNELMEAYFLADDFYDAGGHLGDENMPVYDPRKKSKFNLSDNKPKDE